MIKLLTTSLVLGMLLSNAAAAADFVLVEKGAPKCTIVVPNAPGPAWFAAGELRYHVRLITGADLPVVKEKDAGQAKGPFIAIGETALAAEAGLGRDDFGEQEYAISFLRGNLLLVGRDARLEAAKENAPLKLGKLPRWYTPVGSLHATYDLLERYCGVRWYAPGEEGMVYPKTNTLRVRRRNLRRRPALEFRHNPGSPMPTGWGMTMAEEDGKLEKDLHTHRLKIGGRRMLVNHTFEGFPARFWAPERGRENVFEEKRPDYFALNEDGTRTIRQMCFSSTGLVAQVVKDAREYFDGKGLKYRAEAGADYYAIVPRDTVSTTCRCKTCQARYAKNPSKHFSSGNAKDRSRVLQGLGQAPGPGQHRLPLDVPMLPVGAR